MYYRRQTVTSSDGSLVPENLNGSLQVLYRQYHSNNRIVKDARKEMEKVAEKADKDAANKKVADAGEKAAEKVVDKIGKKKKVKESTPRRDTVK